MGDYIEIVGRQVSKQVTRTIYRTFGVASTTDDNDAPRKGSALPGTSHTIEPICQSVQVDENRYPGRVLFVAVYEAPKTRAEFEAE